MRREFHLNDRLLALHGSDDCLYQTESHSQQPQAFHQLKKYIYMVVIWLHGRASELHITMPSELHLTPPGSN